MVVMGHSQGGLLTKMTAIDTGMHLWPFSVPPDQLNVSAETRDLSGPCADLKAAAVCEEGGVYRHAAWGQLPGARISSAGWAHGLSICRAAL